tara:strand:- start:152 stop:892 length:741 start_codon:yes stop_codon:yes gene_type:complete
MYRYKIIIEYDGTHLHGFQIQKKNNTVQQLVQSTISKILKEKIKIIGSGRTDAGVHAWGQTAHFDSKKIINNTGKLINSLNFFLNKNLISIIEIKKKKLSFHARYSARERIYEYVVLNRFASPSIDKNKAWYIRKKLDLKLIKKASQKLSGKKDFKTFQASNCYSITSVKTLKKIIIKKRDKKIIFHFKSKSFLRNQVRSMVGCLVYVGQKKWSLKKFENVLKSKKRKLCAPPAPAHGLYLLKVNY